MTSTPDLAEALQAARGYLEKHGREPEVLGAQLLVEHAAPDRIEGWLASRQREDGAVERFGPGEVGALAASVEALGWLAALDLLALPSAERLAGFVAAGQLEDGSLGADPEHDLEARLQQSGRAAAALARMVCVSLDRLEAAGDFLARQWSVERVQGGRFADLAPFLPFFAVCSWHELSDAALQWCGRELERSFRSGRLSALEVASLFVRCDARSLPATRVEGAEIVSELLLLQRPDGGFGAEDRPTASSVADSYTALVALARLGSVACTAPPTGAG